MKPEFYIVEPPTCGEFGPETKWDPYVIPQIYFFVHFVFDRWPDDLVTRFPVFLANKKLVDSLLEEKCTGLAAQECKVSKSEYFHSEHFPEDANLPVFERFLAIGSPQEDDFGILDFELIVSKKAKKIIEGFYCESVYFKPV